MNQPYREVKECRICSSKDLVKYLDLGKTPLANKIVNKDSNKEETYPLEVLFCKNCCLSQLSIVVNPEILFSRYVYRSSVSKTFQEHCKEMAETMLRFFDNPESELVVDIASNDGCLLKQYKNKRFNVVGVEPAENIANIANDGGINTICAFWSKETANEILEKYGQASVITATNVFAHVDNLNDFLNNVKILLKSDGFFIVEVPYAEDLIKKNEFDTIYHEHLSYFLVKPLMMLYKKNNLTITRIEKHPIHGGSLRIYAKNGSQDNSVKYFYEREEKTGMHDLKLYQGFQKNVDSVKHELTTLLRKLKNDGKTIAAYGASAKGNTLLNYCQINTEVIDFIADDTPQKQGMLAPGSKIPIINPIKLESSHPDYLLLLAWNFADELIKKTDKFRKNGMKYIIPVPKVQIT